MIDPLLLVGISVLMHVAWNVMARHVDARCNYLWWGLLAHLLLLGPLGVYGLVVQTQWSWLLVGMAAITMMANSIYFIGLRHAYARAPAGYVYPLARSSPLLIVLWEALFFQTLPNGIALLGILLSLVGLWWLATTGKHHAQTRSALPWIVLAAIATSVYSLSDKVASTQLLGFYALLGFVTLGYLASFVTLSALNLYQIGRIVPACRPAWGYVLVGGLFIGTAYALVIHAMQTLPAAYVVTFTNAGIMLMALLSVVLLREREHWRQRLLGAALVGAGLLVLGVSR